MYAEHMMEIHQSPPGVRALLRFGSDLFVSQQGVEAPDMQVVDFVHVDQSLGDQDVKSLHSGHDLLHFEFIALE
jgi:hypothetical protein